jgi:hypothetical protein
MTDIGYFKDLQNPNYIVEIKVLDNIEQNDGSNSIYASYVTKHFTIISITSIIDDTQYTEIDENLPYQYRVGNTYTNQQFYFKTKDVAFFGFFNLYKQWKLFPNGFSGVCRNYYDSGELKQEYFRINSKIYGKRILYDKNGKIIIECNYSDGIMDTGSFCFYKDDKKIILSDRYCEDCIMCIFTGNNFYSQNKFRCGRSEHCCIDC